MRVKLNSVTISYKYGRSEVLILSLGGKKIINSVKMKFEEEKLKLKSSGGLLCYWN